MNKLLKTGARYCKTGYFFDVFFSKLAGFISKYEKDRRTVVISDDMHYTLLYLYLKFLLARGALCNTISLKPNRKQKSLTVLVMNIVDFLLETKTSLETRKDVLKCFGKSVQYMADCLFKAR